MLLVHSMLRTLLIDDLHSHLGAGRLLPQFAAGICCDASRSDCLPVLVLALFVCAARLSRSACSARLDVSTQLPRSSTHSAVTHRHASSNSERRGDARQQGRTLRAVQKHDAEALQGLDDDVMHSEGHCGAPAWPLPTLGSRPASTTLLPCCVARKLTLANQTAESDR